MLSRFGDGLLPSMNSGKIIFLNGASSSGKSTLAKGLQAALPLPFWHYSIDHIRDAGVLPMERIRSGEFVWSEMRGAFFTGFHHCLPALASAGNHLLVEHIFETKAMFDDVTRLLKPFDVFYVGVHCPLTILEQREKERGNRPLGSARHDFETTHTFCTYDMEVDSTQLLEDNVKKIITAWQQRFRVLG